MKELDCMDGSWRRHLGEQEAGKDVRTQGIEEFPVVLKDREILFRF